MEKTSKISLVSLINAHSLASANRADLAGTKLGFVIQKNDKKIRTPLEPYYDLIVDENEAIEVCSVTNASTDDKGNLLFTLTNTANGQQKVYSYTKENEIKRTNEHYAIRKEYKEKQDALLYDQDGNEREVELTLLLADEYPAPKPMKDQRTGQMVMSAFPLEIVEQFKNIYLSEDAKEKVTINIVKTGLEVK